MRKFRLFIYFSILTQTFVYSGTINFSNFESTVEGEIVEENIGVNVSFVVDPTLSSTEFINISPKVIDLTVEPKPLNLEILKVGDLVQLKWERGKLQKSNDLNPNWEDVRVGEGDNEGVSSPYFYPVDQKNIFFRVSD